MNRKITLPHAAAGESFTITNDTLEPLTVERPTTDHMTLANLERCRDAAREHMRGHPFDGLILLYPWEVGNFELVCTIRSKLPRWRIGIIQPLFHVKQLCAPSPQ